MNIIEIIKQGSNPEQLVMNYLSGALQSNPIGSNLLELARNNNTAEIERIARNIVSQQGKDFDTEFNSFKQMLGIK